MTIKVSLVILTAILTSCGSTEKPKSIIWDDTNKLPPQIDGTKHLGVAGPTTGIIGDRLIIAGGANFPDKMPWNGGAKNYPSQAYIYQIRKNELQPIAQQELKISLAYAGNCSVNDLIFIAGGENESGAVNTVKSFGLEQDSIVMEALPKLPIALTSGSLVHASNKLFFVGGQNETLVSDKIYTLDLSADNAKWDEVFTLPYPVSHAVVVSNDQDKIYVIGGRMRNKDGISTIYKQIIEIDLSNNRIKEIGELPQPLAAGTGILDKEGNILIFGGDDGNTFHQAEKLIARLSRTTDPHEIETLNTEKANVQSNHPGFTSECWSFNTSQQSWTKLDSIPGQSPVTTSALVYNQMVIIPSGEIKAGVRTDQILIGKLKQ